MNDAPSLLWTPVSTGRSGDDVCIDSSRTRYRKRGGDSVRREWARMQWLAGRVPVPVVLDYRDDDVIAELTTSAMPGAWCASPAGMAAALRLLHALPAAGCPFDSGWHARLAEAAENVRLGEVDESDVDAENLGRSPESILDELRAMPPPEPDATFIHGDPCVPNVLFVGDELSGFVDLGRAGIGCRALDLTLACRSLDANLGSGAGDEMLARYGLPRPSESEMRRWRLLDELF